MHSSIERLVATLAPPAAQPAAPPWSEAVAQVGFRFPADYRDFADTYGMGRINDELVIWTPSLRWDTGGEGGFGGLVNDVPSGVGDYLADLHDDEPAKNPYPVYPAEGGLIAWGNDYSGDHCFWSTERSDPDDWPVVVWFRQLGEWSVFNGGFADFLLHVFDGAFPHSAWLVGDRHPVPRWDVLGDWSGDHPVRRV